MTGTAGPDADTQWAIEGGKIVGNTLTLSVTDTDGVVYKCTMTLNGNKLSGNIDVVAGGQTMKATIDLNRSN